MNVWLRRALQLALTVGVTWFIVDRVGLAAEPLAELPASAWLPDPLWLAAASAALFAGYLLSGALWARIVSDLGGPELSAREAAPLFMIANLGRYVPGKVWQIAGLAVLAQKRGVPAATATASAVLGQGVSLVAATAIGLAAFLGAEDPEMRTGALVGAVVLGIFVAALAVPSIFRMLVSGWFRVTRTEGPASLASAAPYRWLALYAVNWALYGAAFWLLARGMTDGAQLLPMASAFAAAYVLGYLFFFSPAGIGVREGFLMALLAPQFGVALSGVIAIVARLWTTLVEVVPAGLFWARFMRTGPAGEGSGAA